MVRNTGLTLECTFANPSASIASPTTMNVTIKTTPNDAGSTEQFVPTTDQDSYLVQ